MKSLFPALLLCVLILASASAKAQSDDDNIRLAKNALDMVHSCDDALNYLNKVSADGKQKTAYLLNMAKANDCKENNAQAIYYYNKYLENQPGNDSVKKRVAELSDEKRMNEKAANESRIAKTLYQNATKKRKQKNLDENYYSFGLGFGSAVGGADAAYKHSFEVSANYGFPIIKNKLLLEISGNLDFMLNPSADWYARAFDVPTSQISGLAGSANYSLSLGVMPVLVNNKDISLAVGPVIGGAFMPPPGINEDNYDYSFATDDLFKLCYGLKADLFLGRNAVVYLQYMQYGANTATALLPNGFSNTVTDNRGMLVFGLRYKISHWGEWGGGWGGW